MPVLVVDSITCQSGARDCTPNNNPTGTRVMGVGFAREMTSEAVNYDGLVASIPANNPFLHIYAINGTSVTASAPQQPGSPGTTGDLTSGYILTPNGVTLGLTAANTANFGVLPLNWHDMTGSSGFNGNWADWGVVPVNLKLNGQSGSGYVLTDTGIRYMMVQPYDQWTYQTNSACSFGGFASSDCLVSGTTLQVKIGGNLVDYAFTIGGNSGAPAAAPPFAVVDGTTPSSTSLFVNTGYHFFNQYAYVYDYVNGYVGFGKLTSSVPEPASGVLMAAGLMGLKLVRRRRRRG